MATRPNPSVLIIEDEQEFRLLLRLVLDQSYACGEVTEAAFADDAVAEAARLKPDAILLDVHLPDGDGASLIPFLRAASPDSVIVLMSSDPDTRDASGAATMWVDKANLLAALPHVLGLASARS